jgi:putative PIN family toxin of toxin-antitoxin system
MMKKIKIILDTNIWISYLISKNNNQWDTLIFSDKIQIIYSEKLLNEFIEVTQRDKFRKFISLDDLEVILNYLGDFAIFVENIEKKYTLCRDLKDNFLLDLAVTAEADFLVTGDKDLLEIKTLDNVRIISPTDFINLIL